MIDVNFDYVQDTPPGGDPDSLSPTLNRHHQALWGKVLPNGKLFDLRRVADSSGKLLLHHNSGLGEFFLCSDMITHSLFYPTDDGKSFAGKTAYAKGFPSEEIRADIPNVIKDFWRQEIGIACYTVFPARQINRQQTLNQARGVDGRICDRFDLTLECIRRYYEKSEDANPLVKALLRYRSFFDLFGDFRGYVEFFHLQDLIENDGVSIRFWLPFDNFHRSPLPQSPEEYSQYKDNVCAFIQKRRTRMSAVHLAAGQ